MTVFEIASIGGSLITGRFVLLSSLLALSFSTRKWSLHAGNVSAVGINRLMDPRFRKIWVLRDDVEIEISTPELQDNDITIVRAGDIVRLHGVVIKGEGIIRQYSLAGIIQAIPKSRGDAVFPYTELAAGELYVKYD